MTPKQNRIIIHAIERLFGVKSWLVPSSNLKDLRDLTPSYLTRVVRIDARRTNLLSDVGVGHFRSIVSAIMDANEFEGRADYSDVSSACREAIASFLKIDMQPDSSEEFLQSVRSILLPRIQPRIFIVSFYGVSLKGIDQFALGRFRLVRPSARVVTDYGIVDRRSSLPTLMRQMGEEQLWFVGKTIGSTSVAEREFFHQARLTAGLFAISAASTYEGGAEAFRIAAVVSPEEARASTSVHLSWIDGTDFLGFSRKMRKGQEYEVGQKLAEELNAAPVFATMVRILQQTEHTSLEAAIVRAVYWFYEAHRDPSRVMRLIKFWSCIESFFSQTEDITKAVATGTASVLTFGPFCFVQQANYPATKKRLTALYKKRSKAVHNGMHDHVERRDLSELSQWAAWLILSMAELTSRYTDANAILEKAMAVDSPPKSEKAVATG